MGILAIFSLLTLLSDATRADFQAAGHVSRTKEAAVLPTADFVLPITSKVPRRESKKKALAALLGKSSNSSSDIASLAGAAFDHEYLVNITVGGKTFNAILDTGSSDTWVVHEEFSCFDLNGTAVPAATCDFGPAQFNPADSPTFTPFVNATFFVRYGSGESLRGPAGFDTVTAGGLSVSQQEIGVPTLNAFLGDGVSEGVLGLAFPGLTSVYTTNNASELVQMQYTPFFLNAMEQKKVKNPFFSISLDRATLEQGANDPFDANLGFLAFGGIAPVPVLKTSVTVPVQGYTPHMPGVPSNAPDAQFLWYTLDIDSFTFRGSSSVITKNNNTIFDSGSTFNNVHTAVAAAYNAQFNPPATLDATGTYVVACNATAPAFAVVLGGTSFEIDPRDQIVVNKDANGTTFCVSGTQDGGPDVPGNLFALGDVFFHNVVMTFNPVAAEVTIMQRAPY
ncbi:aspartic peptidase domain-containing protein [Mycena epipterygia]|nr:aspartic peptidase domain-containing protein [Mycena epipterygia]